MSPTSLEELEVKGADLKAALARIGFLGVHSLGSGAQVLMRNSR